MLYEIGVIDISYIIHFLEHGKSSSISQFANGKLRDLQKLLKYFNGTETSASKLYHCLPCSLLNLSCFLLLYSKDLLVALLLFILLQAALFSLVSSFVSSL